MSIIYIRSRCLGQNTIFLSFNRNFHVFLGLYIHSILKQNIIIDKINLKLLFSTDFLLSGLSLTFTKYDEYNGTWYYIYKDHFDLFMLEVSHRTCTIWSLKHNVMQEPYHSFTMLVNFSSSEYIFRVLGTTKERGFYSNIDDLREIVENKFANTVSS